MKVHIDYEIIHAKDGTPAYAVIPYDQFLTLNIDTSDELGVPHEVVSIMVRKNCSITRAWREHLGITQQEMADRLGVAQPTYQRMENSNNMQMDTRKKIAKALGIHLSQLAYYDYPDE
jgi:DNA-binding XRE family transcriptional regulator